MIAKCGGINSNQTKGHPLNIRRNALFTQNVIKNIQRHKLEGATLTNGLFLQRETVPQIKQDLID
jgi:hypothetical protein